MIKKMKNKFEFYRDKLYDSKFYGSWIHFIIFVIVFCHIACLPAYPGWVERGTAGYQITESTIEIETENWYYGEWYSAIIKGYVDNGEERNKFKLETKSAIISKEQIGATSNETVVVESVVTYGKNRTEVNIILASIITFATVVAIIKVEIDNIKEKRKARKVAKK